MPARGRAASSDLDAIKLQASYDAQAAATKAEVDAQSATRTARIDYDKAYYQAMLDTTGSAPDRWRSAAELVQKSAAAIGTLYAGILGVTFSVSGHPLPVRGLVPALFLGLAIATSTIYVAYLTPGKGRTPIVPAVSPPERMRARLNQFLDAVHESVERRVFWLRASVMGLALGVLFLPAPFIAFTQPPALDLNRQHPWPSPPVVSNAANASVVSIAYKSQVDEVAAERQRAEAAQSSTLDLGLWTLFAGLGLASMVLVPFLTWLLPILYALLVQRMPVLKRLHKWMTEMQGKAQRGLDRSLPYLNE